MKESPEDVLRVAVLAGERDRGDLRAVLEDEGIDVVLDGILELPLPDSWNGAEVLLVGMAGDPVDRANVRGVLQQSPVPVLLNHGGIGQGEIWNRRLVGKLQTLARRAPPSAQVDNVRNTRPDLRVVDDAVRSADDPHLWVVVLGGSIGGPKAIAQFLAALPDTIPVVLLIAQHISEAYQDLLVEQLDRCSSWPVALPGEEQMLEAGHAWMVPAESTVELGNKFLMKRSGKEWDSAHQPDIDALLERVADKWPQRCGVIFFSGLGSDGVQGCSAVSRHDGFVWTQSAESCTISNLPEAAQRNCTIEFSGTPEELAEQLVNRCQIIQVGIN